MVLAVTVKLVVFPIMVYLVMDYYQVSGLIKDIAILFASVPCAVSAYILAGQLRGDQPLMASIITVETILAIFTIPILLYLF